MYSVSVVFLGLGYAVPLTVTPMSSEDLAKKFARQYYRLFSQGYPVKQVKVNRGKVTVFVVDETTEAAGL